MLSTGVSFMNYLLRLLLFLAFGIACTEKKIPPVPAPHLEDYIHQIEEIENTREERLQFFDTLAKEVSQLPTSPQKLRYRLQLADLALNMADSITFYTYNQEALEEAVKQRDTIAQGEAQWNFGSFLLRQEHYAPAFYHYSKARENYGQNRHPYYEAKMYYNMAFIKGRLLDYTGSEHYIYKALPYFLKAKKQLQIFRCYTQLGLLYEDLEGFDKALHYHQLAFQHIPKNSTGYLKEEAYNNIGLLWYKKENFRMATHYYEKALQRNTLPIKNPALYARLIDNRAVSLIEQQTVPSPHLLTDLNKAKHLRDSLHNQAGVAISNLHLATYYLRHQDSLQAIHWAKKALHLSKSIDLYRESLASLVFLTKVDPQQTSNYVQQWEDLQREREQSLRQQRHKVAKIEFETLQYQQRSEQLVRQKRGLIILLGVVGVFILGGYMYIRQKNQLKKLQRKQEREQQLRHEREEERYRIAEDLHDGVLGKLFGLRLHWSMLDLSHLQRANQEQQQYLDQLHHIEKEIRDISHNLKKRPANKLFLENLEALLSEQCPVNGLAYHTSFPMELTKTNWPAPIQAHVLAIVQEVLLNTIKHAEATQFHLFWKIREDDEILLKMWDNGIGFDAHSKKEGIGLSNIQHRIEKIKAIWSLETHIGKGTQINIRFHPLDWQYITH